MRRVDVASLVAGLLLAELAAATGWMALGGVISRELIAVVVPVSLVAIGAIGLLFSRATD